MKIAMAQLNPTIGDFAGNGEAIERAWREGRARGADLVVTPELAVCGYPPMDLLERPSFVRQGVEAVHALARRTADGPALIVGFPEPNPSGAGNPLFNAAAVCRGGEIVSVHRKSLLPNYDVFDEARWFEPAAEVGLVEIAGTRIAVTLCEDIWNDHFYWRDRRRGRDPIEALLALRPELVLNLSASPWHRRKHDLRLEICRRQAARGGVPLVFVNQVGGQDELIFDGSSMAVLADGSVAARAAEFAEDLVVFDTARGGGELRPTAASEIERVERALVLGLADYFRKSGGFGTAVVGLSGGIDSAVVATLAVRALGAANVIGVRMPSRYSSRGSLDDAAELAHNLGIRMETLSIEPAFGTLLATLAPILGDGPPAKAEQMLQARIRAILLMGISNKLGHIVLSTANKSELATGYCALYGDMAGGLAVIADLNKMMVYELAEHFNRQAPVIPSSSIEKAPSAELAAGQKDQDTLPPYPLLDSILDVYVEQANGPGDPAAPGLPEDVFWRVTDMVDRNEFKRRQSAPALRITSKAFGIGRRIPIARRRLAEETAASEETASAPAITGAELRA